LTALHPQLLFTAAEIRQVQQKAGTPILKPVAASLLRRAKQLLDAPPLIPSITQRGQPDPKGELKGLECARRLQGRVLTYCMAFSLTSDERFKQGAVGEMEDALDHWRIWVDTAHQPPFDLMTGEVSMTLGLAYDWLYQDLSPSERVRLKKGAEEHCLKPYLEATKPPNPMWFFLADNNWNPVCNGGAVVLALALRDQSKFSAEVIRRAVPAMDAYWDHLGDDGAWDEGTAYWGYGHRYAFLAAEALRRCGLKGGAERFAMKGAATTGYFPLIFNPGKKLSAGFGDSNARVHDPLLYLLGREYRNPDFIWFQDRNPLPPLEQEGWPEEALELLWRPVGQAWLPENRRNFESTLKPVSWFSSIGWALMAPQQPDPAFFLSFKNGSLAANHTHLDLNNFSLAWGDTMLAEELGSRPYPADYFSSKRFSYYEISTAGHNCVLVGGKGQVLGRPGKLLGPVEGPGYVAFTGVADKAYEIPAPRARRTVVFVKKRYWVLLDEIGTDSPQTTELRFHTYGDIKRVGPGHWTFVRDRAQLDIACPLGQEFNGKTQKPDGWIRPVNVLSLQASKPSRSRLVATVLMPHKTGTPGLGKVSLKRSGDSLLVQVGQDEIGFRKGKSGWLVTQVR
jgi:hypothetical protein